MEGGWVSTEAATFGCLKKAKFNCIKIKMFCKYRYCKGNVRTEVRHTEK
jgi:hypothetical protein